MTTKSELDEIRKEVNTMMLERINLRKAHLAQSHQNISNSLEGISSGSCNANKSNTLDDLRAKAVRITKI